MDTTPHNPKRLIACHPLTGWANVIRLKEPPQNVPEETGDGVPVRLGVVLHRLVKRWRKDGASNDSVWHDLASFAPNYGMESNMSREKMGWVEILMENIEKFKKSRGIKQNELAKLSKVSESTLSHWRGHKTKPTLDNIERIADVLGVELFELFLPEGAELPRQDDDALDAASRYILMKAKEILKSDDPLAAGALSKAVEAVHEDVKKE